jgi:hypothetical protein
MMKYPLQYIILYKNPYGLQNVVPVAVNLIVLLMMGMEST